MRAPKLSNMFSLLMGSGAQVATVYLILMAGFNLKTNMWVEVRPALHYLGITLISLTGVVNGYVLVAVMRLF